MTPDNDGGRPQQVPRTEIAAVVAQGPALPGGLHPLGHRPQPERVRQTDQGLDHPAVGFLHRDRSGRPSLALDLMEELRPLLADRPVLSLVNRQQVLGEAFRPSESGAVFMDDDTRKTVITAYQQRKQEELQHPFLQEKIALGLLPHAQALLLARYLRGDLDGYPPYMWK